ncbi:MAG: YicC family protein [Chlamydiae bacterium]|nr:YicC family protein [Chlamydiota bacterium]
MIASMTGFGRSSLEASFGKLTLEIQSVNRKHLEISVSLPKEYTRFESDLRKWISEKISRGQVSVRVYVAANFAGAASLLPSFELLSCCKKGWEDLAEKLGYETSCVDLSFLTSQLPTLSSESLAKDEDLPIFEKCTKEALKGLLSMKQTEGKALSSDIEQRLHHMEEHVAVIETLVPDAVIRMKKRMQERVLEAFSHLTDADERGVLREIAMFAEKVDIAEEVTRLRSHIVQFRNLLTSPHPIGRKMDFLVQEMGREINTVGSKSLEAKIAHLVVEVKSELEKIREQIQNIE